MEKVIVTGGLGFLGHRVSLALKEMGFEVIIIDNYSHNINEHWHKIIIGQRTSLIEKANIEVITADTTEEFELESVILDINPERIIHTAAIPDARLSNRDPSAGFNQNLLATKIILEIIRRNKLNIKQFTYFSSSMVYGDFKSKITDEYDRKDPKGIYGAAKLSSELLIKAYHNLIGLPYTIIRPSALYGPRCINNRVTQVFIEKALRNETITIQGDGSQKLDFTFIEDFIDGFKLTQIKKQAINNIFNITTGKAEPIRELLKPLENYFDNLKVQYVPWDDIVPIRGTLSIKRITELGYSSSYTIKEGYPEYIEWYLKHKSDFNL